MAPCSCSKGESVRFNLKPSTVLRRRTQVARPIHPQRIAEMTAEKSNVQLNRAHVGHFSNPDHPSWKLSVGKAYEATPEERAALRQCMRENRATAGARNEPNVESAAAGSVAPISQMSAGPSSSVAALTPSALPERAREESPALSSKNAEVSGDQAEASAKQRRTYLAERGKLWREKGVAFIPRVLSAERWAAGARLTARREGCSEAEAMRRNGYISELLSLPNEFNGKG